MPWIRDNSDDPEMYGWPAILPDEVVCGHNNIMQYAKQKRKETGQLREEFTNRQKKLSKDIVKNRLPVVIDKNKILARYYGQLCADLMKEYRGWDAAIKLMDGAMVWPYTNISEQIALYVDRAFGELDCFSAQRDVEITDAQP